MCRSAFVLLLTSLLATPLAAQQWPVTMLPVPPMPSIGLPLPHIGLPPPTSAPEPTHRQTRPPDERPGRQRRGHGAALVPLFVAPIYVIAAPPAVAPAAPPDARETAAPESGTLRLEIEPATESQVYVDGYYVGISDGSDDLDLTAGAHRVEVRAGGYEPLSFDVRLSSRQPVTYRARLERSDAPRTTATPPTSTPMTLYVIPGCYAGNVPPTRATLAPGCDPAHLTTLER